MSAETPSFAVTSWEKLLATPLDPQVTEVIDSNYLRGAQALHQQASDIICFLVKNPHNSDSAVPDIARISRQIKENPLATAALLAEFLACAAEKPYQPRSNTPANQTLNYAIYSLAQEIHLLGQQRFGDIDTATTAIIVPFIKKLSAETPPPITKKPYFQAYLFFINQLIKPQSQSLRG